MRRIVTDGATGLARLPLARWPTPYDPAPRLAARLGLGALHVKREDLAGVAMGGNKIRQIELILAAAVLAGADTVVTTASSQSNFCRAMAGACAASGMGCHLLLRRAGGGAMQGNLLLHGMFGAGIGWIDGTDPWAPAITAELESAVAQLRREGRRPFLVQLPGETAALAAAGWVSGAAELVADFAVAGEPDVLVVACGSGLTLAGLALGLRRAGCGTRVLGVSVQMAAAQGVGWVVEVAARTAALIGSGVRVEADGFGLTEDQVAPGYGQPSAGSIAAVRMAGREAGLVLDPAYSGKAMAGLVAAVGTGLVPAGARVAFVHSGGAPGLFLHAGAFAG